MPSWKQIYNEINELALLCVTGAKPRARPASGGLPTATDEARQGRNDRLTGDAKPAAEIIPERHAVLDAGLGETEEGIAAIAADVASSSGADLAAGHLATDVVLGAVGVQWRCWPLEHHQQLGLVGMQPREQSIQRNEAGAVAEDSIEPRA